MTSRFESRSSAVRQLALLPNDRLPWLTVRDALLGLPAIAEGDVDKDDPNHFLNPGARTYARHTGSPLDEPAKTVKAGSHGVPGGESTVALDDERTRHFSVRECARLQTFPDDWVFEGTWSRAMRQVGNAVPVECACESGWPDRCPSALVTMAPARMRVRPLSGMGMRRTGRGTF
ncbi:DNA cytosine methyltransferase [Sorangium sp. So ce295]|uniref:DNA cytosine methyltransferase n=1 Tax=Sorangium sp. So ce295 TaxID=3133295 RepID=UPI003F5EA5A7